MIMNMKMWRNMTMRKNCMSLLPVPLDCHQNSVFLNVAHLVKLLTQGNSNVGLEIANGYIIQIILLNKQLYIPNQ